MTLRLPSDVLLVIRRPGFKPAQLWCTAPAAQDIVKRAGSATAITIDWRDGQDRLWRVDADELCLLATGRLPSRLAARDNAQVTDVMRQVAGYGHAGYREFTPAVDRSVGALVSAHQKKQAAAKRVKEAHARAVNETMARIKRREDFLAAREYVRHSDMED